MSKFILDDGVPQPVTAGIYRLIVTVTVGPVVLSNEGESGFQPMTDGSFAASEDGLIELGDERIQASIPAGDAISLNYVRGSKV
jgi:hypothetical protein